MFHHEMCLKDRQLYPIRITVGELQMLVGSCGPQKYVMVSCNHKLLSERLPRFSMVSYLLRVLIFLEPTVSACHSWCISDCYRCLVMELQVV